MLAFLRQQSDEWYADKRKETIFMTNTVKQQILAIQATGETNMFDVNRVQHIANRKGYYELVVYLEGHRKEYANFILTGKEH